MGERLVGRVSEGKGYVPGAEFGGDLSSLSVELNGWALAFGTDDFYISPANAAAPTGTKGLHPGFLGREAGSVTLKAACLRLAITDFSLGENATQEAFAMTLNRCTDARDFGDINTGAKDHRDIVNGD